MRYFHLFLLLCSGPASLNAQIGLSRNVFYVEALGLNANYSLNYERHYYLTEPIRLSTRIGLSVWDEINSVPVGLTLLHGKGSHRVEGGIGFSVRFESKINQGAIQYHRWIRTPPARVGLTLAYRFQPQDGGWMFRLAYQPFLNGFPSNSFYQREGFTHWLGIGFGYAIPYYR
ncbi:MAG: hypothetical protein AAFQ87_05545 [Bacteroidota bacterium]